MRTSIYSGLIAAIILLTGCAEEASTAISTEPQNAPAPTDGTTIEPMPTGVPDGTPSEETELSDELKLGKRVYLRCRSCHTLKEGEPHLTGPNLYGFLGRPAASKEGFRYSNPLIDAELIWDTETLDAWLESPSKSVKGTTMAFAGLRKPNDRAALIAYLEHETGSDSAE